MLDDLDRALVHALRVDGRAPFNRIATALDVSPQTVARRYQRLRAEVALRVVGVVDAHRAGQAQWLVRLTTSPHTAQDLARALVRRPDTSWVKLTSGGTEITTIINTSTNPGEHSLLLRDIPRTSSITAVSAHCLLHTYLGGPRYWRGSYSSLSEEQVRMIEQPEDGAKPQAASSQQTYTLSATDHELLVALQRDGRASHAELAAVTGLAPVTVARRLEDLQARGTVFFDVEIDPALLGAPTQALLWMSVAPAHLHSVATTLAEHEELAFVAATTGPRNLVANALCSDPADLHQYLAHRLGSLPAIHTMETAPVLQTLKASGPADAPAQRAAARRARPAESR
ncbi:Lrp/AsnC family transcriptional regulator [Actinospica durhamensis]|uniref:Lrp/AsnC family transcriptional regulator n=1 Tax=Actinospica durhamensis TaxID=1508375 RepID=A0A941EJC7_9ACTN|nr:AsnC family transcriptional regulator [Actinospica durhamensis]MBR7831893.1 Lrp/AsnC family transcriptional regulator [Actinospica durhamensis]